jgi:hypothetical protein
MAVSENDSVRFVLLKRAMRDDFAAVGATAWLCKTLQEIIYASPASWMRFSVVARRRRFVIQALQNRAFLHFSAGGKMTVRICACT